MTTSKRLSRCGTIAVSALLFLGCDEGLEDAASDDAGLAPGSGSGGGGTSSSTGDAAPGAGGSTSGPGETSLIDDMEDKEGSIIALEGRVGAWYTYNDESGTQTPPAGAAGYDMTPLDPPRGDSTYAAHTSGEGFTVWGAGVGFDLNNDGTAKQPYDASQYTGITFWAKAGTGGIKNIRLNVQDAQTAPEGGICDPATTNSCDDHRGSAVVLTEEWKQFTLTFASLKQLGWGKAYATFQTNKLFAIQFQAAKDVKFDLWIDDIAFYK